MSAIEFLKKLPAAAIPDAVDGLECTVQLNISTPVYLSINGTDMTITEGTASDADVSLTLSDDNLIKLLTGELGGVMAFMTGKLKIDGDLMLAKEIPTFFDPAKLV